MVGDMFELPVAADVAECPHSLSRGVLLGVDDDMARGIEFDATSGDVETVSVGLTTGGDQHDLGLHHRVTFWSGHVDLPGAGLGAARGRDAGGDAQVVAIAGKVGVALADIGLFLGEHRCAALDLGHRNAQSREDVGEFAAHEATTEDDHPVGKCVEAHDGVRGVQPALGVRRPKSIDRQPEGS